MFEESPLKSLPLHTILLWCSTGILLNHQLSLYYSVVIFEGVQYISNIYIYILYPLYPVYDMKVEGSYIRSRTTDWLTAADNLNRNTLSVETYLQYVFFYTQINIYLYIYIYIEANRGLPGFIITERFNKDIIWISVRLTRAFANEHR